MIASGLGAAANGEALARVRDGRARIVYCSPERFGSSSFLDAVASRDVDLLAVDEAHCVSEWGHDFRPDYLRLPKAIQRLGRPTVIACTATATPEVAVEIERRLGLRTPLVVRSGFDRPNISFDTVALEGKGSKARKLALLEHGLRQAENRPAIVYCGTRRDSEAVAESLRAAGVLAAAYHAGMAPDERASAQHRFMSGDAEVIVATNAFGMGIDKAERALRLALGDPDQRRGLLPGGRASGARRQAGARGAARRALRPGALGQLQPAAQRRPGGGLRLRRAIASAPPIPMAPW